MEEVANLKGCIIAVHEGHVAIHEYQLIAALAAVVHEDILLDHAERFFAVEGQIASLLCVDAQSTVQDDKCRVYVEALVVNY